ncbi:MAG: endonuclease Q family protein [Minisyncoccia bacterium]
MRIIVDLHIHSKYSRATSKDMDLEHIALKAKEKGLNIVATGDFTHPEWFQELKEKLEPAERGLYRLKNDDQNSKLRFILSVEISNIYTKNKRVRRVHNLVIVPSLEAAEKINNVLSWHGNLKADGRPILGLDSEELLKIVFNIEKEAMFIPAHIWTPWFSVFGSMSGFDSLEEAFNNNINLISALETGLSSDPKMNWMFSKLDQFALVSNSDAHSLNNLGREANVFDIDFDYYALKEAIVNKDRNKFLYTIEFYPEEGKYHYDGHRLCKVSMSPEERKKVNGICPVCHKPLTIGVLSRVEDLADRPYGFIPDNAIPFKHLIPLREIIADVLNVQVKTKLVEEEYQKLVHHFKNEFTILLDTSLEELKTITKEQIAEAIINVRQDKVELIAGYDGEYGKIHVLIDENKKFEKDKEQKLLF